MAHENPFPGAGQEPADLLCGILKDGENLGVRAVQALGVDLPAPDLPEGPEGTGALAPDALDALANAFKVALDMRHDHIGTEHVVIAMAADGAPAHDIFAVLGVTDRLLRQQIERMIANPRPHQHVNSKGNPTPSPGSTRKSGVSPPSWAICAETDPDKGRPRSERLNLTG